MKRDARASEFHVSQAVYAHLLRAYPRSHRAAYGAAMAQLFRDQCVDAWNEARIWGLWKLWGRTLPDLACTSILERLAALKERKTMSDKLANLFAFRVTPASTFFRVFAVVFLLVFLASVAVTFILPESYASTARIRVEKDVPDIPGMTGTPNGSSFDPYFIQTTFEIVQSELVLSNVIAALDLNKTWGQKYANGQTLKSTETMAILKQRLLLAPVKNTELIAITVYSEDKQEAAAIANAVADSYRNYRQAARAELAAESLQPLQDKYQAQALQIEKAQASVDALQKKYDILGDVQGLGTITVDAEKSFQEKNILLSQLRPMSNEQRRRVLPLLVSDSALSNLLGKLDDAGQKFVTLTNDYSLSNVEVTRVTSLMAELNRQIDDRVAGIMAGLESQLASLKAVSEDLAAKVQKSKPTAENTPYWAAKQDLERLLESHKILYAKIEEQKQAAQVQPRALVQITDPAVPGRAPVRPNKPLNLVLGAVAGVFLATLAGAAFASLSFLFGRRMRKTSAAT
jgi:uncharacterized protein involved in exopolysaccharide biosynthesis